MSDFHAVLSSSIGTIALVLVPTVVEIEEGVAVMEPSLKAK